MPLKNFSERLGGRGPGLQAAQLEEAARKATEEISDPGNTFENIKSTRERKLALDLAAAEKEGGWLAALDPRKPLGQAFRRCLDSDEEARFRDNNKKHFGVL